MKTLKIPFGKYEELFRRSLLLSSLYILVMSISITKDAVLDPDIGWHLRTGQWIYEHGEVPRTDPFSIYGQGKPWVAYSWLFELLVYGLYQVFGPIGLVVLTVTLSLCIASVLLLLLRTIEQNAAMVIGLTALGIIAMSSLLSSPRPWLFSMLFFVIEMNMLLRARRSEDCRPIAMLPVIYVLWSNLHIEFIYGFLALGAFLVEPFILQALRQPFSLTHFQSAFNTRLWAIAALCIVATLATPYHIHLYQTIIEYASQSELHQYISELHAMGFHELADWIVLALTVLAVFMLGRRRELQPFHWLVFVGGIIVSFRCSRDVWFVVISAVIIIASSLPASSTITRFVITWPQILMTAVVVSLLSISLTRKSDITNNGLDTAMAKTFPVAAVDIVKSRQYPGPIYNHFNWGGYLIWRLPHLQVSMDGRT
ncbi:MAG: hypothetical protein PHE55_19600, partial [Methylococcaceae bacterium]|nr:hypothetical protein [Methylococcaceae bacterium]